MSHILEPRQLVTAEMSGIPCQVESFLGGGGQGEVYAALLGGSHLALKWYYPESATAAQRTALEALVRKGAPGELFLWPIDLASAAGVPGFGYLMPLRPDRFRSGTDLAKRRVEPTFRALTTAGIHLAHGFLQLHASGLAYRDVSFGNLFLDPDTGDVRICDLDNVGVDGQPHNLVGGTMRFMAPEIVRGEALPSTRTDQYSLAVLLHLMFFMAHPLEGKRESAAGCLGPEGQRRIYGTEPVYVADPKDSSNRPERGWHDNLLAFWPIYPRFLKQHFTRAFTEGLRDPAARVKESEWRAALTQLRDCIVYCQACGAENFFDPSPPPGAARPEPCWACRRPVVVPLSLHLGKALVMLNHDTRLYPHHVQGKLYDFGRPAAEVARHPTRADVWGLKNLSGLKWTCTDAGGQVSEVGPGRSVTLAPGVRVRFGGVEGEIRDLGTSK
jgi:DNA-binding helix-hairpin-helix protein with protein kinase domain